MKSTTTRVSIVFGLMAHLFTALAPADVVAYWTFEGDASLSGGELIEMQQTQEEASTVGKLMTQSEYLPAATGLSAAWSNALHAGYITVGHGREKEAHGLVTVENSEGARNASYADYMGFRGLGGIGSGGSVYMVIRPTPALASGRGRAVLFGTSRKPEKPYPDAGWLQLGSMGKGDLSFIVGKGNGESKESAKSEIDLTATAMTSGYWYFLAASWAEGTMPVLYLRQMDADKPASSPAAIIGVGSGEPLTGTTEPSITPFAIGAYYVNDGGNGYTMYGGNADIALVCIENTPCGEAEFEERFKKLAQQK